MPRSRPIKDTLAESETEGPSTLSCHAYETWSCRNVLYTVRHAIFYAPVATARLGNMFYSIAKFIYALANISSEIVMKS